MFTPEDWTFVRAILANPAELTAWLVYADWLDEHDHPIHAEYLRLMAQRGQPPESDLERFNAEEHLQALRDALPWHWVIVFDRPAIENCEPAFQSRCPKQWENLKVTRDPTTRHCDACGQYVDYCRTLLDAQTLSRVGHRVAVQLGVLRHPDDMKPCEVSGAFVLRGRMEEMPPPPPRRPWWKFW